jgi:hypothetical protein
MTRLKLIAFTIAALALTAAPAIASPTTASFTVTQTAPLTVTVDSSATVCPWGFCSSSWRYYGDTTNRLGATMGYGSPLTYRFSVAGVYSIVLTYSVKCSPGSARWCPATSSRTVGVM